MEDSRTFAELMDLTRRVAHHFDARERRTWSAEAQLIELMRHLGDLSRHLLATEGYYLPARDADPRFATTPTDLADKLADIVSSAMRIADHYRVDLEAAFVAAHERELDYLP